MGTDLFSEFNLIDDFHRLKFQFSAPLSLRTARVMKFAQHGKHRLAIEQQAAAVHGNYVAAGISGRAEFEITSLGGRWRADRGRQRRGGK
jgi:hypothetical protein